MRLVTIYGLYDVRQPGLVYYVGLTLNPRRRLSQHLQHDAGRTRKSKWVARLKSEGYPPALTELAQVSHSESKVAECQWIKRCRNKNPALLNIAPGGGGLMSADDVHAQRSHTAKEIWSRPGYREKWKSKTRVRHLPFKRIGPLTKWGEFYDRRRYYKGWRHQKRDTRHYVCQNPECGITYQRQVGRRGASGTKFCSRKCSDYTKGAAARIVVLRRREKDVARDAKKLTRKVCFPRRPHTLKKAKVVTHVIKRKSSKRNRTVILSGLTMKQYVRSQIWKK